MNETNPSLLCIMPTLIKENPAASSTQLNAASSLSSPLRLLHYYYYYYCINLNTILLLYIHIKTHTYIYIYIYISILKTKTI